MASSTIRVEGLKELQRAFKVADDKLKREFRARLREVAEPVRSDAEGLAVSRIPTAGIAWSRMRVGVTSKTVYVAPKARGRKYRRPNFGALLHDWAMEPALERNEPRVMNEMEDFLRDIARAWEHA